MLLCAAKVNFTLNVLSYKAGDYVLNEKPWLLLTSSFAAGFFLPRYTDFAFGAYQWCGCIVKRNRADERAPRKG